MWTLYNGFLWKLVIQFDLILMNNRQTIIHLVLTEHSIGGWKKHVNKCDLFKQIMFVYWCKQDQILWQIHAEVCAKSIFFLSLYYINYCYNTLKNTGKQMHEASGNLFRHLTWYFPRKNVMRFKCQNSALRFEPAWTCVYISGTIHVCKDFHVYVCVKVATGCLALCTRQWANFLSIGVLLYVWCFN